MLTPSQTGLKKGHSAGPYAALHIEATLGFPALGLGIGLVCLSSAKTAWQRDEMAVMM